MFKEPFVLQSLNVNVIRHYIQHIMCVSSQSERGRKIALEAGQSTFESALKVGAKVHGCLL